MNKAPFIPVKTVYIFLLLIIILSSTRTLYSYAEFPEKYGNINDGIFVVVDNKLYLACPRYGIFFYDVTINKWFIVNEEAYNYYFKQDFLKCYGSKCYYDIGKHRERYYKATDYTIDLVNEKIIVRNFFNDTTEFVLKDKDVKVKKIFETKYLNCEDNLFKADNKVWFSCSGWDGDALYGRLYGFFNLITKQIFYEESEDIIFKVLNRKDEILVGFGRMSDYGAFQSKLGLMRYDKATGFRKYLNKSNSPLESLLILDIVEYNDCIWILTGNQIIQIDSLNSWTKFEFNIAKPKENIENTHIELIAIEDLRYPNLNQYSSQIKKINENYNRDILKESIITKNDIDFNRKPKTYFVGLIEMYLKNYSSGWIEKINVDTLLTAENKLSLKNETVCYTDSSLTNGIYIWSKTYPLPKYSDTKNYFEILDRMDNKIKIKISETCWVPSANLDITIAEVKK